MFLLMWIQRPVVGDSGCNLEYVGGKVWMVIGLDGVLVSQIQCSPSEKTRGSTPGQASGKAGIQLCFA